MELSAFGCRQFSRSRSPWERAGVRAAWYYVLFVRAWKFDAFLLNSAEGGSASGMTGTGQKLTRNESEDGQTARMQVMVL